MESITTTSLFVIAGYGILQMLLLFFTDRILLTHVADRMAYARRRFLWVVPFLLLSLSAPLGTFFPDGQIAAALSCIGNVFLGYDLFYACVLLTGVLGYGLFYLFARRKPVRLPLFLLPVALAAAVFFPLYGYHHAQHPVVNYYHADLTPEALSTVSYRVVLIADLHLSVNSSLSLTQRMVEQVNQAEPDLILVGGDVFTSSYESLKDPEIYAAALQNLRAKDGIYAVYGNHDVEERLFAGFAIHDVSYAYRSNEMDQFFQDCGFTVLEDETTTIAGGALQLAGRRDLHKAGDGTAERLSAKELLSALDPKKPILVLEHEPEDYAALREAGADLVLSGHTHNGQIVPGNLVVHFLYENGYGYRDISGMATFVTSGIGYFGPPLRLGTDSEVMVIDIRM